VKPSPSSPSKRLAWNRALKLCTNLCTPACLTGHKARAAVFDRIDRLALGNFGDAKSMGDGVKDLRFHLGPGYRIYFCQIGATVILLLVDGEKRTQDGDIKRPKALAAIAKGKS